MPCFFSFYQLFERGRKRKQGRDVPFQSLPVHEMSWWSSALATVDGDRLGYVYRNLETPLLRHVAYNFPHSFSYCRVLFLAAHIHPHWSPTIFYTVFWGNPHNNLRLALSPAEYASGSQKTLIPVSTANRGELSCFPEVGATCLLLLYKQGSVPAYGACPLYTLSEFDPLSRLPHISNPCEVPVKSLSLVLK